VPTPSTEEEDLSNGIGSDDAMPDDTPAPSSGAEGAENDSEPSESLLEAIEKDQADLKFEEDEDVLDDGGETPAPDGTEKDAKAAEADPNAEDGKDGAAAGELPEEVTAEELKAYPPKSKQRIEKLLQERHGLREELGTVKPYIDFMQEHDIPREDLDIVLGLTAALRKGDFRAFLEGVSPYVELAQQYTGQTLPPDLQQQVEEGYVTREIAHELAARRANETILSTQNRQTHENMQMQQAAANAEGIRNAISSWEQQKAASDPDYPKKADLVRRTAQAIMQEHGGPQNAQQALQMAEAAYHEATQYVNQLQPAPKATRRTPSGVNQSTTRAAAQPGSLMEAALEGLRAVRE